MARGANNLEAAEQEQEQQQRDNNRGKDEEGRVLIPTGG